MSRTSLTDTAVAIPTKQFFVSMLTRDISLADAILDLVDNCLDGALRAAGTNDVDYSVHAVRITLTGERFEIVDNCGGIPREVARNYAFKMGREAGDDRDSETETIGMYGVGMKRAIFKMGRDAVVRTRHNGDAYQVPISAAWLDAPAWDPLPIKSADDTEMPDASGTQIEVRDLFPGVARHFELESFVSDLREAIGEHFTLFLQRGLTIEVNGDKVMPVHVEVLVSADADGPAPYVFRKEIDEVVVSIVVGLNSGRGLDDDGEPDFERNRSAATAGWSVFCNERAVIVGDKSRLTGWGDGIPLYHPQFSVITGIVQFRSTSAEKLPVTTTKRALDTSSDVWLEARTKMREGLRVWINHTNAWKNHPRAAQAEYWKSARPLMLEGVVSAVLERKPVKRRDGSVEYNPRKKKVLPQPASKVPSSRRIVFSRPADEIREVSAGLFDRPDQEPGVVGDQCFHLTLEQLRASGAK